MRTSSTLGFSGLALLVALIPSGCATKKWVRQQTTPIQQRVEEVDKKQSEAVAALDAKEQRDISRVEERAMTAESKANDAARAAQQADEKAVQAGETARTAATTAQSNQAKIGELDTAFQNIDNFKVVASGDVLFGFNRSNLTDEAKAKLDELIQQATAMPRYVMELEGYTDRTGPSDYNLALSQRRADTVLRYLVDHNVPLRRIHMVGLGEQSAMEGQPSTRETRKEERKVVVKIWGPEVRAPAAAQTR
jgi:OOP family OmpA-OmpF porin